MQDAGVAGATLLRPAPPTIEPADLDQIPPPPADQMATSAPHPKGSRPLFCNAQMGPKEIRAYCAPGEDVKALLRAAIQQLGLSARAYDRLLKVARTVIVFRENYASNEEHHVHSHRN